MSVAFTFPGQGSQTVGMGKAFAETFVAARAVFAEVDDALSQKLSTLMFEGPEDQLTLTANAQPALMAVSLAILRVLEAEAGITPAKNARFVAGHSLGEYSALAAAGSLTIADTARLLRIRGNAMQAAVAPGVGAMAALLGLDFDAAAAVAQEAVELAKTKGAKRAVMLSVSAPFHCALMKPAADAMAEALSKVKISAPVVPLVGNVTAAVGSDPEAIRHNLVTQVTGTVRWRESVAYMAAQGVTKFVEIGSGKVLTGLVKRIAAEAEGVSVSQPDDVANLRAQLGV
ncbi:MAG: ACP S-malonyltransferase [Alphaproteobacteria bacterium]|nr:ACP S-malonyltransferase [Alphaproteobacteria bacterium]